MPTHIREINNLRLMAMMDIYGVVILAVTEMTRIILFSIQPGLFLFRLVGDQVMQKHVPVHNWWLNKVHWPLKGLGWSYQPFIHSLFTSGSKTSGKRKWKVGETKKKKEKKNRYQSRLVTKLMVNITHHGCHMPSLTTFDWLGVHLVIRYHYFYPLLDRHSWSVSNEGPQNCLMPSRCFLMCKSWPSNNHNLYSYHLAPSSNLVKIIIIAARFIVLGVPYSNQTDLLSLIIFSFCCCWDGCLGGISEVSFCSCWWNMISR